MTTHDDASRQTAWTAWTEWPVGCRVVVRRRLPEGGYSDVLGELLANTADGVRIITRRGEVEVPAAVIAIGKRVPPAPPRRPARNPDGAVTDQWHGDVPHESGDVEPPDVGPAPQDDAP